MEREKSWWKVFFLTGLVMVAALQSQPKSQLVAALLPLETETMETGDLSLVESALGEAILNSGQLRLVERRQLHLVLEEQGLQQSGICGDSCMAELGQVLGVRFLFAGQADQQQQSTVLSLRLLDASNASVIAWISRSAEGPPAQVTAMLARQVVRELERNAQSVLLQADTALIKRYWSGMVALPGGTYLRGSAANVGSADERPMHQVELSPFLLDSVEVTQENFQALMRRNPSQHKPCSQCPVERVRWEEAKEFCERTGRRLPTEAEWEYAARAGSNFEFPWGDDFAAGYAQVGTRTGRHPFPVGIEEPNAFGMRGMLGNVAEWTADNYARNAYLTASARNPKGPPDGDKKVVRGGFWYGNARLFRPARREARDADFSSPQVGFRCAADPHKSPFKQENQ